MSRFPPTAVRERLAREVGGTLRQVQVWFQNRRQRDMTHRPTWQTPGYMMVGFNGAPGYYPSPDPMAMGGPYGQPVMYMQPPMVPMPGALQHIAPGPPSMPVPGAPGAVPMPNSPPMQAAPTNRTQTAPTLSRAHISLLFRCYLFSLSLPLCASSLRPSPTAASAWSVSSRPGNTQSRSARVSSPLAHTPHPSLLHSCIYNRPVPPRAHNTCRCQCRHSRACHPSSRACHRACSPSSRSPPTCHQLSRRLSQYLRPCPGPNRSRPSLSLKRCSSCRMEGRSSPRSRHHPCSRRHHPCSLRRSRKATRRPQRCHCHRIIRHKGMHRRRRVSRKATHPLRRNHLSYRRTTIRTPLRRNSRMIRTRRRAPIRQCTASRHRSRRRKAQQQDHQ